MRRAVFICRPCLALIRRQHFAPSPGHSVAGLATTLRSRGGEAPFRNDNLRGFDGGMGAINSLTNTATNAVDQPLLSPGEYDDIIASLSRVPRRRPTRVRRIRTVKSKWKNENDTMPVRPLKPVLSAKLQRKARWKHWQNQHNSAVAAIKRARKQEKYLDSWLASKEGASRAPPKLLFLLRQKSVYEMKRWWFENLRRHERVDGWQNIMAAALYHAPARAHEVLMATYEYAVSSRHVVGDVLHFLVNHLYRGLSPEKQRAYRRQLARLILYLLQNSPKGYLDVSQHAIFIVSQTKDRTLLCELYEALREYGHTISGFTKLHFVTAFAQDARWKSQALDVLQDLVRDDSTPGLDSAPVAAAATSIIACAETDILDPSLGQTAYNVIAKLSDFGLRLNMYTCTAILRVFCLSGEMDKAWKVFEYIDGQGNIPDNILLSTLLHGAKRQGDFESVSRVLQEYAKSGCTPDAVICNDVLHAIHSFFVRENQRNRQGETGALPTFPIVLQAYAKLFKLEPLQSLLPTHNLTEAIQTMPTLPPSLNKNQWQDKIRSLLEALDSIAPAQPLDPGDDTLSVTLSIYVRSISNPLQIVTFYAHFRNLIESGNRAVRKIINQRRTLDGSELSLGSLIHDTVIHRLNSFPGMLRAACDVMRDMLRDKSDGQARNRHPVPSAYTYNHLLHSLMNGLQFTEAEATLDMMINRGVVPNVVTWNIMIRGYARSQDAWMAVNTVRRMEKAGFAADESTARAFGMLRDRTKALQLIDQLGGESEKSTSGTEGDVQIHTTEGDVAGRGHAVESFKAEDAFLAMERELTEKIHSESLEEKLTEPSVVESARKPVQTEAPAEDPLLAMERKLTEKAHSESLGKNRVVKSPGGVKPASEPVQKEEPAEKASLTTKRELVEKAPIHNENMRMDNIVKGPSVVDLARELLQKEKELAEKERELAQKENVLKIKDKQLSRKNTRLKGPKIRRYGIG